MVHGHPHACSSTWVPFEEAQILHILVAFVCLPISIGFYYYEYSKSHLLNNPLLQSISILPVYVDCLLVFVLYSCLRACVDVYFMLHTGEDDFGLDESDDLLKYGFRNFWSPVLFFLLACVNQGCWHAFEWFILTILYQRNGGIRAYLRAKRFGLYACIIYTIIFSVYLITGVIDYLGLYYLVHLIAVSGWFIRAFFYSTASKRRGAKLFYAYIVIYCILEIFGSISRLFAPKSKMVCLDRIGQAFVATFELPALYFSLRQDSRFWRNLIKEISKGSRRNSVFKSVIDIENILSLEVPFMDNTRFEEEEIIGSGATAIVSKCLYEGEWVAVKSMTAMNIKVSEFVNLVREVFVAKALKHENLVALRGIALIPPEFCIVSEYCSQGTLVQSFNMPWRIRLELLLHAVKGIAYLHHRDICHRDLKLENVLIHLNEEGDYIAKLADFGTAKILEATKPSRKSTVIRHRRSISRFGTDVSISQGTTNLGTFLYMAPEILDSLSFNDMDIVANQSGQIGLSVDIYSLGIIFWEVHNCRRAYDNDDRNMKQLADCIINEGLRPYLAPMELRSGQAFNDLISKCWATSPFQRPLIGEVRIRLESIQMMEDPSGPLPRNAIIRTDSECSDLSDEMGPNTFYSTLSESLTFHTSMSATDVNIYGAMAGNSFKEEDFVPPETPRRII